MLFVVISIKNMDILFSGSLYYIHNSIENSLTYNECIISTFGIFSENVTQDNYQDFVY